jgi:hypothetical protein
METPAVAPAEAPAPAPMDEEEDQECMICCDVLPKGMSLPCACRTTYCPRCWDRCLAVSYKTTGIPRCPTCRVPVQVDYNVGQGLVFSRGEGREPFHEDQLYRQARDAQVALLKEYKPSDECKPLCVCGGALQKVQLSQRLTHMVDRALSDRLPPGQSDSRFECFLERLLEDVRAGQSPIRCDLCWSPVLGDLWTCTTGERTILHPASYDICENCFNAQVHPCGDSQMCLGSTTASATSSPESVDSGSDDISNEMSTDNVD